MKRYIYKIVLFFIIIAIIDKLCGVGMNYVNSHAKGGATKEYYDIINNTTADIIILGSSRAVHHYDPTIISDSLRMSCYNCGNDGNGILNMYGRFKLMSKRYNPQIVIYDVYPDNEYFSNNSNIKDLCGLKPFADSVEVLDIFRDYDKFEMVKLQSYLYRYNTSFFQLLNDYIRPEKSGLSIKGFRPMKGVVNYEPAQFVDYKGEIDILKTRYLNKLIEDCKNSGTTLVFSVSPRLKAVSDSSFNYIKSVCKRNGIPFISFYTNEEFRNRTDLFKDSQHLNERGAKIFTTRFVQELMKRI